MLDNAEKGGVSGLLGSTNLLYEPRRVQAVVDRIERQPDWVNETAKGLADPSNRPMALYVLCWDPARLKLSEDLQERCAARAGTAAQGETRRRVDGGNLKRTRTRFSPIVSEKERLWQAPSGPEVARRAITLAIPVMD